MSQNSRTQSPRTQPKPSSEQVIDPKFSYFNVEDRFKGKSVEEIRASLAASSFDGAIAMMQLAGDFNFSSVVRNANAFGITRVFYIGEKKHWDRRGAVGTHNYINVHHCRSLSELVFWTSNFHWVGLENNVDYPCTNIYDYNFHSKTLLLVGEEGQGLSRQVLNMCDDYVSIPQYGSVRSLNAATATGIALSEYARGEAAKRAPKPRDPSYLGSY